MIGVKSLLEKAQDADFWKTLNPQLKVCEDFTAQLVNTPVIDRENLAKLIFNLKHEGYFQIDSFFSKADISRMATGIEKLRDYGFPLPFAFIYDEFWQTFSQLSQILSAAIGEDYRQLPDFWAWYIETSNADKGWQPHRDNLGNTLLADGRPKCVTIWIPLSDAIPLNGCMYILPAPFDPYYNQTIQIDQKIDNINFQNIRALPAVAGSVLCWNHAVLHWGGRSSERAPHPRISLAFEFQRGDIEPFNTPLLDPKTPPNFNQRLSLIGKQILQYKHMYPLSEEIAELATELEKFELPSSIQKQDNLTQDNLTQVNQDSYVAQKIRDQFDAVCYPNTPLENSPKDDYQSLYIHNLVTSYYLRNQKVIKTQGKVILDAGCGSGYKSLVLAEANPGAKIIGIDFAEESVKLARQRLQYHGFENTDFYAIPIEELPSLGLEFDYINCDEVLYLLPDISAGLQVMKSALKTDGIIRTNLHSSLQRFAYFRAQEVLKDMGLMDENPGEMEMELVRETMTSLKDQVLLKALTWNTERSGDDQWMQMNYLLQGDKGYTITEVFSALRDTDLEFISMVNWRHWEVMDLFKEPENISPFLAMSLPDLSVEGRLHLYEMLHPVHRLIDFWCGNANHAQSFIPLWEWSLSDWQNAQVHLHPQLQTTQVKEDLIKCINNNSSFEISRYLPLPTIMPILIDSSLAACLLPLWDGAKPVASLVERWLKLRTVNPVTLEPVNKEMAWEEVKELLKRLEVFLYVLLERLS